MKRIKRRVKNWLAIRLVQWADKAYAWSFKLTFGKRIPANTAKHLLRLNIDARQIQEFCSKFYCQGYYRTWNHKEKTYGAETKLTATPEWTLEDGMERWLECASKGDIITDYHEVMSVKAS